MLHKRMFNWRLILPVILIFYLTSCSIPRSQATPTQEDQQFSWPTATPLIFVTRAPDNSPTATPTPTARPLTLQPRGQIVFQSDRDGGFEIYLMNTDGSALSRLTSNPAIDVFPDWSPDGSRIVFTSDREGDPDIFIINADGTNLTRLTDDPASDVLPRWSPDGNSIAFVSNRDGNDEIYVMSAEGGDIRRLTNDTADDLFPHWSPDGDWIVFSTNRDVDTEIYVMNKNGGQLTRLTNEPAADSEPAWSPDGTRIAFISRRDGFANLFVMNRDGSNVVQLTFYKSIVEVPAWSPDGRMIVFSSDMQGNREIYIIGADGNGLNRLTNAPPADLYPDWSPGSEFLTGALPEPTPASEDLCIASSDPGYGYTPENPVKLGYDPRAVGAPGGQCLPWLSGLDGQPIGTELLEEVTLGDARLCKVRVFYEGNETGNILYFDTINYEQPRAPVGYSCGSMSEYLRMLANARNP